jgi:hypothetical protein
MTQFGRRDFVKSAAAGMLGAVGLAPGLTIPLRAAQEESRGQRSARQTAGPTLPPPEGLGPHGVPDQRHAMKWETPVPEAMRIMTDYFEALNRRDLKGMAECCHFPFATFEGINPVVVKSADDLIAEAPASMNMSENPERWTDHDSFIKKGSYDTFHGIEILASDPAAVNLAMTYNRYGPDGKMLLQCQGAYCVTNDDGKWGIELMSTIFTPALLTLVKFPGAEEEAMRTRIVHDIGPDTNDSDADGFDYQYGPTASVSGTDGFMPLQQDAAAGHPMSTYRIQGVKSRLHYSAGESPSSSDGLTPDALLNIRESGGNPNNPPDVAKYKDDWKWYANMYDVIGIGRWGFTIGVLPYSRVVHATFNKGHLFSGLTRYNTVGEELNTSTEMAIVTWRKGRWGKAGAGAYITMHDRANDVRNIRT